MNNEVVEGMKGTMSMEKMNQKKWDRTDGKE